MRRVSKSWNALLSEIFIKLLAKQLAQMRCVSKSWNALLSHSSFVKSHLHRSIHNNEKILMFFDWKFSFDRCLFAARPSHSLHLELNNFIKLPVNSQSNYTYGNVIGYVNGLICFYNGTCQDHSVHIWNPSLSIVLTLPPCSVPSHNSSCRNIFRLGFDPKTDDYKVVKVTKLFGSFKILPQVEVYSMRKGSWELISQSFPSNITNVADQIGVCVDGHDGHVHWLGYTDMEWKKQMIVTFDLDVETFSEIPLPDSLLHRHHGSFNCYVGVLYGKLCVTLRVRYGKCEVWVMDEYGVSESWIKHQVFPEFSGAFFPYGFTSQNKFLFQLDRDIDRFALYDPVAAKSKIFKILLGQSYISKVVEYVDSLVWIAPANKLHV